MNKKAPFIIAISGVGGAGKNSVMEVFKKYPDKFEFFISCTDRLPRPDETPNETYIYITPEEFSQGIKKGEFIEWEQVRGETRYGRKKADFKRIINSGKIPVMQIEPLGLLKFKKIYKTLSFFITPPSLEVALERMKKRGTSEEDIEKRTSRYNLEMSYKNKYDYIVINDDLSTAQEEVVRIVKKEITKKNLFKSVFPIGILLTVLLTSVLGLFLFERYENRQAVKTPSLVTNTSDSQQVSATIPTSSPSETATVSTPPPTEVKKKIAASPPKNTAASRKIVQSTKKNSDGTSTVTVSTGGTVSASDLAKASQVTTTISTPMDIVFSDETGMHADLGPILKSYITNTLEWKGEISSMKEITLRNAGATGWNGQYLGQYSLASNGVDITSATGTIILNSYYYQNSSLFNDYMKLTLSHEYGHHYTLYHKWVDWDMAAGTRFPDSYYNVRPLPKSTTASDYSLGWGNCDAEIIAEDYSYFFSGYGLDAMASTYGYPSSATKTWLLNIGDPSLKNVTVNNPPTLTITSPAADAVITGSVQFQVDASDDIGVAKVSFYIGDNLISEDTTSPYAATINSATFPNGSYVLKAVASDGTLTTEKTINVTFDNTAIDSQKPTITVTKPAENPFTLTSDNLDLLVAATDNVAVSKIEFYFEDNLQGSWNTSALNLKVSFSTIPSGTYTLKFIAYDSSGNTEETTLTIIKP